MFFFFKVNLQYHHFPHYCGMHMVCPLMPNFHANPEVINAQTFCDEAKKKRRERRMPKQLLRPGPLLYASGSQYRIVLCFPFGFTLQKSAWQADEEEALQRRKEEHSQHSEAVTELSWKMAQLQPMRIEQSPKPDLLSLMPSQGLWLSQTSDTALGWCHVQHVQQAVIAVC